MNSGELRGLVERAISGGLHLSVTVFCHGWAFSGIVIAEHEYWERIAMAFPDGPLREAFMGNKKFTQERELHLSEDVLWLKDVNVIAQDWRTPLPVLEIPWSEIGALSPVLVSRDET